MTTERTEQPRVQRRLRRRSDERVLAGVASGLGDYFNVDPLLIRIALVASIVFGGMGIFLYVAAWLLVPDETTDTSIAERLLGRAGLAGGLFGGILVLIGAIIFFSILGSVAGSSESVVGLGLAVVVIVLGAMLLRRGEPDAVAVAPDSDAAVVGSPAAAPPRTVVRRPARPRSPLGWYVLGAALVGIGLLALAANVSGADILPGQFFGLALGVIGIGLVVGTWWGHARGLILLGLLLLPFAWAASLISVPIEGGFGDHRFSPTTAGELRDEYRLVGGQIMLDLAEVDRGNEPVVITASVAMGEIYVLLPEDAGGELVASVGGGRMGILGANKGGTGLEDRYELDGDGQEFVLDLEAGVGSVRVETREAEGR